jgi:hypothetical protein
MCVAALPAILAIGQGIAGFAGASGEASAQNAYYNQNRRAAIAAANDRYASLNNKTLQERAQASAELLQKQTEALKARATATASAGEAGVTGLSVDALQTDFLAQQGRQSEAIEVNFETARANNADEAVATYHNTIGRINSVRTAAKPSPIPFILQAAGAAFKKPGAAV